jgi:hypothetical protein
MWLGMGTERATSRRLADVPRSVAYRSRFGLAIADRNCGNSIECHTVDTGATDALHGVTSALRNPRAAIHGRRCPLAFPGRGRRSATCAVDAGNLSDAAELVLDANAHELIAGWRATARIKADKRLYAQAMTPTEGDFGPVETLA